MTTSEIRTRARANLSPSWPISVAIAAVASLLGGILCGSTFVPEWQVDLLRYFPFLQSFYRIMNQSLRFGSLTIRIGSPLKLAAFLIGGVLQLGYARFLLSQHDGRPIAFSDLFSQFHRFGQGFAQRFLRQLYIALWSLLLVIPGIVKSYSYAMTPFLMADDPNLTATEAIDRSKTLMNDHKMELFALDLTFLGWDILAALTLNLGHLLLNPYKNAAHAVFYRNLLSHTRPEC